MIEYTALKINLLNVKKNWWTERGNHFLTVMVKAGKFTFKLSYEPWHFLLGNYRENVAVNKGLASEVERSTTKPLGTTVSFVFLGLANTKKDAASGKVIFLWSRRDFITNKMRKLLWLFYSALIGSLLHRCLLKASILKYLDSHSQFLLSLGIFLYFQNGKVLPNLT